MSATRASSTRALRSLASSTNSRQLNQRGIRLLAGRPSYQDSSRAVKNEHLDTHSHHQSFHNDSHRPTTTSAPTTAIPPLTRPINTSRALRAPNDTSTIDFMYFPQDSAMNPAVAEAIRVPILPENEASAAYAFSGPLFDDDPVHRAEIITSAADGTHIDAPSAMADVHDNASLASGMADVAVVLGDKARVVGGKAEGVIKKVWNGLLDDVFGEKKPAGLA